MTVFLYQTISVETLYALENAIDLKGLKKVQELLKRNVIRENPSVRITLLSFVRSCFSFTKSIYTLRNRKSRRYKCSELC